MITTKLKLPFLVFCSLSESSDVSQPGGGVGDPRCSQDHRGAAQAREEAPGRRFPAGGEGEVPAHPQPLLQGPHSPDVQPSSGPLCAWSLQHSAVWPHAPFGWRCRRRRAEGEVQGRQLQPVHQEQPSATPQRECETYGSVTCSPAGPLGPGRLFVRERLCFVSLVLECVTQ